MTRFPNDYLMEKMGVGLAVLDVRCEVLNSCWDSGSLQLVVHPSRGEMDSSYRCVVKDDRLWGWWWCRSWSTVPQSPKQDGLRRHLHEALKLLTALEQVGKAGTLLQADLVEQADPGGGVGVIVLFLLRTFFLCLLKVISTWLFAKGDPAQGVVSLLSSRWRRC